MRSAPASGAPRTVLYVNADAGLYGAGVSLLELVSWLPTDRYRPLVALPSEGPLADAFRAREVQVEVFPLGALRRAFRPDQVAGIAWSHLTGWRRLAARLNLTGRVRWTGFARLEMGRVGRHQATLRFGIAAQAQAVSALYDEVIDGRRPE